MKKKAYEQPTMKVGKIQQTQMLCGSVTSITTSGLDDDLDYDKDGGDVGSAWVRKNNGYEEEW